MQLQSYYYAHKNDRSGQKQMKSTWQLAKCQGSEVQCVIALEITKVTSYLLIHQLTYLKFGLIGYIRIL